MNNSLIISESEKNRILSLHDKFVPKRYKKGNPTKITEQISFINEELNFQKNVHLHRISMLVGVDKNIYLRNVQNDYALGLFENNLNILENFNNKFLNVLNESIDDFSKEIEKLNHFILESLKINLVEQPESRFMSTQEREAMAMYNQRSTQSLSDVIDYIKEKGIGYIMENIRAALFSGVGTAIQVALSFTGAGAIGLTIVWGIMGLYDLYQLTVNGNTSYLGNFIIDLICCITAGALAKPLASLAGKAFASVEAMMGTIMKSSVGTVVTKFLQVIETGLQSVIGFFSQAATFMKNKMGINWVGNLVSKIEPYYNQIVEFIKGLRIPARQRLLGMQARSGVAKLASYLAPAVLRTAKALSTKFSPEILEKASLLTPLEIGQYIGVQLEKTALATINKEAKSRFREKPTEDFLRWVDESYGTAYGDFYLAYLNGKKMFKYNRDGKFTKIPELGANAVRGEFDYVGAKAADIQKGTQGIVSKTGN